MKAHQRLIREHRQENRLDEDLFGAWWKGIDLSFSNPIVKRINFCTARPIIEDHEWIGTMPLPKSCRYIYGIYFEGNLGGVAVFVEPSTRQFFEKYPRQVVQLNRGACVHWTPTNTASYLLGKAINDLKKEGIKGVIAYCTREAGEYGTIYQSLNFHYCGETSPSKTYFLDGYWVAERTLADKKKWAKSQANLDWIKKFQELPSKMLLGKYRYVLPVGSKKEKRVFMETFNYCPQEYPKRIEK